jgi:dephospho-CoA kinase
VLDPSLFDVIVLVDAPREVRRDRLVKLRGIGSDEADKLIESQMPSRKKRALSDHVIDNGGSLEDLENAAYSVWEKLVERAG